MNKTSLNLFILLLALPCTLALGQAKGNMSCADIVKAHGGVNVGGSDAPALWEIPMPGAVELINSYGDSVTAYDLSFGENDIPEITAVSCIESYLFTNEIDRMAQTSQLNIYDTSLGKRVASLDTFGLPIQGWVIGDIIVVTLSGFTIGNSTNVIFLKTQTILGESLSQYISSNIIAVSGHNILQERASWMGGRDVRHIESLRITENDLTVVESCPVELPEGFTAPLEYTLDGSDLKVIPKFSKGSMSPYLIESCKDVAETFLNSHK
jgi:hypothetical protein